MTKIKKDVEVSAMKGLVGLFFIFFTTGVFATDIVMWHAFDGFLGEKFSEIIDGFNAHPGHPQVKLVHKQDYQVAYEEEVEAHQRGEGPHILQVYEVATLSMMLKENTYIPVGELMQKYHHRFDPDIYIDAIRKFYSAPNGKMLSMP